jgi:hypothetical protein
MKTTFTGHAQSIQPQQINRSNNCNIIPVTEREIAQILNFSDMFNIICKILFNYRFAIN